MPGDEAPNGAGDAEAQAHAGRVAAMFGRIAPVYDLLNRSLSLGVDVYWRRRQVATLAPKPGGTYLDLAAGTLDVSREITRQAPGARVLALDFARPMLVRGLAKVEGRPVAAAQADGRALPLADNSVDGAAIAFGIRNILPRTEAFAELARVLRPGGRLVVLEFGAAKTPIMKGLYNVYLDRLLPAVGRAVSGDAMAYRYLAETIKAFPPAGELAAEMRASGFASVDFQALTFGIVYLHVGTVA